MTDLETERARLGLAERHIAEGEERLTRQRILIDEMRGRGECTARAEAFCGMLQDTLHAWREHRTAILDAIARASEAE